MLISFEGIDGSGKSTQIKLLRSFLEERGEEVAVFREPGGTDISEMVRAMLLNPEYRIDPVAELLLFSSARAQLISERVMPLLAEGTVVILDRFYDSTVAYQGYGRDSVPIEDIHRINRIATGGKAPDLTFYLRVSLEESARRTEGVDKDRMERSGSDFYERVVQGFDALAEEEERIQVIDAERDPEAIHAEISSLCSNRL